MSGFGTDAMVSTLKWAHRNLDDPKLREQMDKKGIDGYIAYCARLAATSGAASGLGGAATLALGVPADLANTIVQQYRVTMAVIYHRTGQHSVPFETFIPVVAMSLGLGVHFGVNYIVKQVAAEIARRLTARMAGRIIPVVGAVVGAGINFAFIKAVGKTLLALDDSAFEQIWANNTATERPAIKE